MSIVLGPSSVDLPHMVKEANTGADIDRLLVDARNDIQRQGALNVRLTGLAGYRGRANGCRGHDGGESRSSIEKQVR